jgi:hypothetical protein
MDPKKVELILGLSWPVVVFLSILYAGFIAVIMQRCYLSCKKHLDTKKRVSAAGSSNTSHKSLGDETPSSEVDIRDKGSEMKKRPWWQWPALSAILVLVLLLGLAAIIFADKNKAYVYLFAAAGFSIAYAIHFFSVSIGIQGVILRQSLSPKDRKEIRDRVEYGISGSGMLVLAGGLIVLFSGGILLVTGSPVVTGIIYVLGGFCLIWAILRFVFIQRHWPGEILKIVN